MEGVTKGVSKMSVSNNNNLNSSKIIVCFLVDGSEKYTPMTLKAIESFQHTTPNINVGLLTPTNFDVASFTKRLPRPDLVRTRRFSVHFPNWNPTQYKLDLVKFADEFETIVWMDSDTFTLKDLTGLLLEFHKSDKNYAFVPDRVMFSQDFRTNWPGNKEKMFIAQACFMLFKSRAMAPLFKEWKAFWEKWISPKPFANYPDPFPSFAGSAFCIEQYALGMAIEKLLSDVFNEQVFIIPRSDVLFQIGQSTDLKSLLSNLNIPQHTTASWPNANLQSTNGVGAVESTVPLGLVRAGYFGSATSSAYYGTLTSSYVGGAGVSSSYPSSYYSSYTGEVGSSYASSFASSYGSALQSSYPSSYASSYEISTSYPIQSSYPSSYFVQSSYGGEVGSSYPSSYASSFASSYPSSYASSYGSSFASSYPSSYASSYQSSYGAYLPSSYSATLTSSYLSGSSYIPSSASQRGFDPNSQFVVDNFAGGSVLHYYTINYGKFKEASFM